MKCSLSANYLQVPANASTSRLMVENSVSASSSDDISVDIEDKPLNKDTDNESNREKSPISEQNKDLCLEKEGNTNSQTNDFKLNSDRNKSDNNSEDQPNSDRPLEHKIRNGSTTGLKSSNSLVKESLDSEN